MENKENRALEALDKDFELWLNTILDYVKNGGKLLIHKAHDYLVYPEFDTNSMKFKVKRLSDDFEGKLYVTIYEVEKLYEEVLKLSKSTAKKEPKTNKPKTMDSENTTKKEKKTPAYKLIVDWVKEDNTLTKEQIREKLNALGGYEKVADNYIVGQMKNAKK